jgi:hypothetical protein
LVGIVLIGYVLVWIVLVGYVLVRIVIVWNVLVGIVLVGYVLSWYVLLLGYTLFLLWYLLAHCVIIDVVEYLLNSFGCL